MRCPHCASALAEPETAPVRMLECASHGGFVGGDELAPDLLRALKRDLVRAPATKLDCPMCGSTMRQNGSHGLTLDVCEVCDGVWFDRGELERAPPPADHGGPARWSGTPLDGAAALIPTPENNEELWILSRIWKFLGGR